MANIFWTKYDIDNGARALESTTGPLHHTKISWTLIHKRLKIEPEFLLSLRAFCILVLARRCTRKSANAANQTGGGKWRRLLGIVLSPAKYLPNVTHPLRKTPTSTDSRSTVRDSEKNSIITNRKSTTGFPTSYRWSAYVVPKSPKGWLKNGFFSVFRNKIQFQTNKVRYKVSLCENFQQQSCRAVNRLWNNRKI